MSDAMAKLWTDTSRENARLREALRAISNMDSCSLCIAEEMQDIAREALGENDEQ
jgi:hypothetical protein